MPVFADDPASPDFTGRFNVSAADGKLVLTRSRGDLRLTFNAVTHHDLPGALEGLRVEGRLAGGSAAVSAFRLHSAARAHTVAARSLQIHERAALYGNVIALPRYAMRERLQWSLLLWAARFGWGQALIRLLAAGRSR